MLVRIHDLSLSGCLIEAPYQIEIGSRVTLHLDLPGEGWIAIQGEAVRVHEDYGFAVKFVEVSEANRARLERAIERLLERAPKNDWTLDGGLGPV
jgi:hypothetical protein